MELAISQEAYDIGIHPSKVKNPEYTSELISSILKISKKKILYKLKKNKRFFF
jgi:hypothetical protein